MFTGNIFGPIFTPQGVVGEPDKGRHPKKKTADLVKTALLGGRGSEKLLKFHHLQTMKSMEGGGTSE